VGIADGSSVVERIGDYLDRFVQRCKGDHAVQGVLLLGSGAVPGAVDALSDLDLMVITTTPRRTSSPAWLESVHPSACLSWTYESPIGGQRVVQAIYDGPLVVDLAFVSSLQAFLLGVALGGLTRRPTLRGRLSSRASSQIDAWSAIVDRGTKVLFDRAGLARRIASSTEQVTRRLPTEDDYLNTVHSALGLLLWESKQLVRGELWMALETVDHQVKQRLLTMVEWHSMAVNPELGDTWYGGRHVEEWADDRWLSRLGGAWSGFDVVQAWNALFTTLGLFSDVATETGRLLGYAYPAGDELNVRGWIEARRADSREA
jgi:aminoglycoside 6-adenylyltransferase